MENTENLLSTDESTLQSEETTLEVEETTISEDNTEEQFNTTLLYELRTNNNLAAQQYSLSLIQTGVITAVFVLLLLYKFINMFFYNY